MRQCVNATACGSVYPVIVINFVVVVIVVVVNFSMSLLSLLLFVFVSYHSQVIPLFISFAIYPEQSSRSPRASYFSHCVCENLRGQRQ